MMNARLFQLVAAYARVAPRAAIFEYPVRAMQARGWIKETNDTAELEEELCRFTGAPSVAAIGQHFVEQMRHDRAIICRDL